MLNNVQNSISRGEIVKWLICAILTLACLVVPEQGIYTTEVKLFLTVTVFGLSLAAFELVPTFFIAIVMPALWLILKVAPASVVMSPWVGTTMPMLVGAFFLGATLEDCGILRRIAFFLMCKVKGSYFSLLVSIMVVTIILNILTSGSAYVIMPPLAAGLCLSLNGMQKKLGAGIASAVMLGACTAHAYTFQAPAWGVILNMGADYIPPHAITPLSIMLHNWPLFFVSLFILFIAYKWFKPEEPLGDVVYFQEQLEKMGKVTRREKVNTVMMVLLLVYIFTISIHGLDINLGFALIPFIVYLPGLNGADEKTIQKVNFSIIFFIAACMAIGTVAGSLGLGTAIANVCMGALGGNTNPISIMGIVFGIVFALNFLMTPMAIWALITEPLLMMVTSMGYSAIPFAYAINAVTEAIILPYEYVPYLITYSFGMMTMKDFVKFNVMRSLVFFLGILFVMTGYWYLIGLF